MALSPNRLIYYGFAAIGAGYVWKLARGDDTDAQALVPSGSGSRQLGSVDGPQGIQSMVQHPVKNIDERVAYIVQQVRKDSEDKEVITEARTILSGKCPTERGGLEWCTEPKDWKGEIALLFAAVTNPNSKLAMRYTRDHATIDLFGSSSLMRRLPAGDCDDFVIRLGALLRAVGYAVRARIVAPAGQPRQWAHIYLMCGDEPGNPSPSKWYALDPTEPQHGAFWEVPDRLISTKKDYEV